jgi:hypothetical protein
MYSYKRENPVIIKRYSEPQNVDTPLRVKNIFLCICVGKRMVKQK